MVFTILDGIFEALRFYITIRLYSNITPLTILLGFAQGVIFQSCQVLEEGIILRMRLDFQITGPSILVMLVLGDAVRTTPYCANMMK